jgi:hypothetical protein
MWPMCLRPIPGSLGYFASVDGFVWTQRTPGRGTSLLQSPMRLNGYAINRGYLQVTLDGKKQLVHRLVYSAFNGSIPSALIIDHRDQNRTNNRLSNLRLATYSQNGANRRKKDGTSSRFRGVSWFKRKRKWVASISPNYQSKHLGYFHDEIDAAIARDAAAIEAFGDFAQLNFPAGDPRMRSRPAPIQQELFTHRDVAAAILRTLDAVEGGSMMPSACHSCGTPTENTICAACRCDRCGRWIGNRPEKSGGQASCVD